ncbi:HprK-related kinase A [Massilia sp. ST3]|uniref:HprK-related kinase A n=1 Tax=Massilia sp. ST3 TaxID=2824903 RepID=UPI001B8383E9|nr:HprK-related kinase A [Massilia sp. ST3]MBQ5948161.1 HprK-related kinase A [Massilia sp. ST3]
MLTVSSLAPAQLRARLQGPGLDLRTGPFTCRVTSDIPRVQQGIALLYADYPVQAPGGFADFHVNLRRTKGLRRWFRPQVRFDQDGLTPFKPLPLAQAYPMFEWVLNWCVTNRAHGYLVVHAAVVEKGGRAVILPAPPGSGKSTLCAALVCRGWRLLSDELCLVRHADGALVPVPRPVSLKNASIGVIQAFSPQAVFGPRVEGTAKGTIGHMRAPGDSVARALEPARPVAIVFPRYEAGAATRVAQLGKAGTFMRVADNAFNYALLGERGFATLGDLVDACSGIEFSYSSLDEAMAVFERLAEGRQP